MQHARRPVLAWVLAAVVLGCGDDRSPPSYSGTAGQPTPLTIDRGIPWISAAVGPKSAPLLLDTGSPLTLLSGQAAAGVPAGRATVDLQAFGLRFPTLEVVVLDQPVDLSTPCEGVQGLGQLGHDLVGHFRLRLDYREQRGALFDTPDEGTPLAPETAPTVTVPFELLGGGTARIAGLDPLPVPASRVVVEAVVDALARPALVDTGSTLTLISQRLLEALPAAEWPRACCIAVRLPGGTVEAQLVRLPQLRLGQAVATGVPVAVLATAAPFADLSSEIGREVDVILGGSFLRLQAVEIDYAARQLRLATYQPASHLDPDEYLLPGFTFCRAREGAGMLVVTVFDSTDAAAQGVTPGDRFTAVDGTALGSSSVAETLALMHRKSEGETLQIEFTTAQGTSQQRVIELQRVLAD